ncbi:TIF1B factor, partial [Galbula dea]|nr:TIF1B factor [Galbula dea]
SHPPGGSATAVLQKVPRVSLERLDLDLDLAGAAQPPVFRVFPGSSAEDFSLIVIERGAQPPAPPRVKEEQQEAVIGESSDIKPVLAQHARGLEALPGAFGELGAGPSPSAAAVFPLPPPPLPPPGPGVSCCRVCCQAGAVVMCDLCEHCYHLDCHLPALQEIPSSEWRCLLCQDLSQPCKDLSPGIKEEAPQRLSPSEQQKCEYVLLELLCHEPCRPLQRLS